MRLALIIAVAFAVTGCWSSYWGQCHSWRYLFEKHPAQCGQTVEQARQAKANKDFTECMGSKEKVDASVDACMKQKGWH